MPWLIFVTFFSLIGISLGLNFESVRDSFYLEFHLEIIELLGFLHEYLSSNFFSCCFIFLSSFWDPTHASGRSAWWSPAGFGISVHFCSLFFISVLNIGLSLLTWPPVLQAQMGRWAPLVKFSFMLLYFSIPYFLLNSIYNLYVSVDTIWWDMFYYVLL